MGSEEFVKKVWVQTVEERDRVKEYMCERGAGSSKRECLDRERWRLFCCGYPLGGSCQRERGVE